MTPSHDGPSLGQYVHVPRCPICRGYSRWGLDHNGQAVPLLCDRCGPWCPTCNGSGADPMKDLHGFTYQIGICPDCAGSGSPDLFLERMKMGAAPRPGTTPEPFHTARIGNINDNRANI